jgi:hypothetical protein
VSDVRDAVSLGTLSILHCLRAPVGGLFRHVADLASAQAAAGHRVGVLCASGGDALTEARLLALAPFLKLGVHRLQMGRGSALMTLPRHGRSRHWRAI